jgi:DNA-binding transcriptional LysR family regulator
VNIIDPELRLLRYFVAVAEERHFGHAAARLHMAQPPLSQQIRKLERELGVDLIDRTCRPIDLTDAGHALLYEARMALVHSERAFAAARRAASGQLGNLRVGAMQAAVSGVLAGVIRDHQRTHPEVHLDVVDLGTAEQITHLGDHRLDVGFLRGPIDDPSLAVETLIEDPLIAVVSQDHPIAGADSVAPGALTNERVILWTRSAAPTTYADVVELFRTHRMNPDVVDESTHVQSILALVAAGLGIAFLPTSFINLARRGVRFVPLEGPLPNRPLALAWRTADRSASLAAFVAIARSAAETYLADLRALHPGLRN